MTTLVDMYTIWEPAVVSRIPSADSGIIQQEIFQAVREFCEQSLAWQEEFGDYSPLPGVDLELNYCPFGNCSGTYPNDSLAEVIYVMEVLLDEQYVTPTTHQWSSNVVGNPRNENLGFFCPEPHTLRFVPELKTAQVDNCRIRAACWPMNDNQSVPEYFKINYFDAVLDGALSRLYLNSGAAFANAELAKYHLARFRTGISRARDISTRRFTRSDAEWAFPRTGWV